MAASTYTYDTSLRWLADLVHTINDTNETITYGYTYEDDGKIDTLDSSEDGLYDYDYNGQDELTDVTLDTGGGPTAVQHYQYDDNGNRESSTVRGTTKAYATGAYNRVETVGDYTFGYDAEGNTLARFIDGNADGECDSALDTDVTRYVWDHRNRLIEVSNYAHGDDATPTQTVEYAYDFLNRLVVRTLDGESEYFIHDSDSLATDWGLTEFATSADGSTPLGPSPDFDLGQIVLQLDEDGSPTHRYLWGAAVDQILADETVDDGSLEDTFWLLTDHQNTVRDILRYDGAEFEWTVANHITYEAFGTRVSETNAAVDSLFSSFGRYLDPATGNRYHGNRWCTTYYATWLSPDPTGFASGDSNLYRLCRNDSVNAADPTGLKDSIVFAPTPDKRFGIGEFEFFKQDGKLYFNDHGIGRQVVRIHQNESPWNDYDRAVADGTHQPGWVERWIGAPLAKGFLPSSEPDLVFTLENGKFIVVLGGGPATAALVCAQRSGRP
ncbi:MAG: hypothetical protein NTW96_24935 [Planctomycetia bacterium]|nr:hypothetical protein [Planctomycetia bacterium]